jgi:hypothetical protein
MLDKCNVSNVQCYSTFLKIKIIMNLNSQLLIQRQGVVAQTKGILKPTTENKNPNSQEADNRNRRGPTADMPY